MKSFIIALAALLLGTSGAVAETNIVARMPLTLSEKQCERIVKKYEGMGYTNIEVTRVEGNVFIVMTINKETQDLLKFLQEHE